MMKQFIASRIICLSIASTLWVAASLANAQQPVRHELIRGDMPPGLAADYYRLSNPSIANHVQPVRVIGPAGSQVDVAVQDGFAQTNASRVSLGMMVGPVYRFKVTHIPQHADKELYPSIEILNRLYPPEGLENEFPIEVVISEDDLKQAIGGRLVTKVIYLENPETTLPHRHMADKQPYFDVGGSADPLRSAEKLGRPMAILRIGSRVPLPSDRLEQFNFNAPQANLLPDLQSQPADAKLNSSGQALPRIQGQQLPAADNR